MSELTDLATVRRVEEHLLQEGPGHILPDLTNLVAIFTQRDNGSWLPVFNVEEIDDLPGFPRCLSLKQLAEDKRNLLAEYNGIVITFEALELLRPDIVTRGPRFYPMEQFYRKLHRLEKLPQTQWKLAKTLFSTLLKKGELQQQATEVSPSTWLKTTSKLFRLTLPALLERFPVDGLLAIIPDENFTDYLEKLQGSLIYVTSNGLFAPKDSLLDLEHFAEVTTAIQLCAAFSEVVLFNERINPKAAGFVDLREELRPGPYSTDFAFIQKRTKDIKTTIELMAISYNQRSQTDPNFTYPLKALGLEYWSTDQELDDIVGIALSPDWTTVLSSASLCTYYLTLPEGAPESSISMDDLLNQTSKVASHGSTTSLRSLRCLFASGDNHWLPLSDVLLRLDLPQVLARSAYLTSRWLYTLQNTPVDLESIIEEAATACYVYSLAEPYYYYWPHGDHEHHLLLSYKNFHEQIDQLLKNIGDTKGKNYYHSLKIWWDYQEHSFKQRKKMPEEALKELDSIRRNESIQQNPAASMLYELFSALLTMFTRTWQPGETRERLMKAGYDQVANDSIIKTWDVLDPQNDLKQPSPLFFTELREFLALSEKSHLIRIEVDESPLKAKQLSEIGSKLGQHIGLNFIKYMSKYREEPLKVRTVGESEEDYEAREKVSKREPDLNELNDSLLLPLHERLWMKSLYYSAIVDHAALIHVMESKPVQSKVFPREVTQYVSTVIRMLPVGTFRQDFESRMEVEVVLLSSEDYDIQEQVVRKKFVATQPIEFTVAFRTTGNVALLFEYIVDKKRHYTDEAWVHIIELEPQVRWINNPYQYGTEIINPQNHYGRRQELEMILNHLRAMSKGSERQNFRLRGMRRSGKTSLLIMIRKAIEDPETRRYYRIPEEIDAVLDIWHPVFYSLQGLSNEADNKKVLDSKVFFMSLTKAICKSLHWADQATDTILSRIDADFARSGDIVGAVESQLERVLDELHPDQHMLILLDEVDLLGSENEIRLFGQLRTLITSPELTHIAWILTSSRALQAPGEGLESPLHNIFAPVLLKNLDVMEAHRMILEPARKEKIYFEPEAVESILQQTGCQPFMLQVICSTLVDQLKLRQTSYVSKGLTDRTITQLLEPGTVIHDQCQFLWVQASASSRAVLVLLAHYEQGMSKRALNEGFQANLPPEQSDPYTLFNNAWEDLLASDLVSQEQGGNCYLKIPIFRQWLSRRDTNL